MVCPLGINVRLSLWSNASVPFGFGFISAQRSFLTPILGLSDLFADPGVRWIASLPSRLFFLEGFVLPCIGVAHSFPGMAKPEPAMSGVSAAGVSRLMQDRHDWPPTRTPADEGGSCL